MEQLDKKQVKQDIEKWANKLREADIALREVYQDLNKIYKEVQ